MCAIPEQLYRLEKGMLVPASPPASQTVNWYEDGGSRRSAYPQGQPQQGNTSHQTQYQPRTPQGYGPSPPTQILGRSPSPGNQRQLQQASQQYHAQPQRSKTPEQQRPAGCHRCGSSQHLIKDCTKPSGAQAALRSAQAFIDQNNLRAASEKYREAEYYQQHDRPTEKLNTDEIGMLFVIHERLRRYWQEQKSRPTPSEPAAPVLHGQHTTVQQHPTEFPELMSFDEDVIQNQDFLQGV